MPATTQYLALIRGINVGGRNLIKMPELRAAFEEAGYTDVTTYIQSGNVLFGAPRQRREELAARIESHLRRRFGTELRTVLLTRRPMKDVISGAPKGFGDPSHRCDVIFLRKPLTVSKAFALLETRDGVDQAWAGKGVVYFSRLASKASSSRLPKIVARPEYQNMTIRSWGTTTRLATLMG